MRKHRAVRLVIILVLVAGVTLLFTSGRFFGKANSYAEVVGVNITEGNYADGIYTGTADGFIPGIVVEVTVKDSNVTSVVVTEHSEIGRQYYSRPVAEIPEAIVETQSTLVDTVSGATATSKGILSAVEDALNQARIQ